MGIEKDIPELVAAGVISQETGKDIQAYYKQKEGQSTNRLFIVFGILGATLVGLGIILILAHNWDDLSRATKTVFAFLPLLIGQVFCGFSILKKSDSQAWVESSASFLFFAVGASISLISQIYNIPGNLSSFILTWMLLCLPLVYLMRSSFISLLYLVGITFFACETGYWSRDPADTNYYWPLLLLVLPHYYFLFKQKINSNFLTFHHWFVPISLTICLGIIGDKQGELLFIAYFSLFGLFYLISKQRFFSEQRIRNNGYLVLGALGTIVLLLTLSFDWFWNELENKSLDVREVFASGEFLVSVLLTVGAGWLAFFNKQAKDREMLQRLLGSVFLIFIVIYLIGLYSSFAVILINVLVFVLGVTIIREGSRRENLGILNVGLMIITALIVCRFFDINLSFVTRGILFVLVGIGFFFTNYRMLKKRRTNE